MTKLKLSSVQDEKPVKLSVALPAALHRDLVAYAEVLARDAGQRIEPAKLIAPMLASFIASDREFTKARNGESKSTQKSPAPAQDAAAPPSRAPD
ncbi:MAG: DUF2274 domain-containing protein [Methylocystis sp.]|uniref:DUF2274 domain-containing protein n=1 Tax=Methylocystis sp. TaxID=1911079 RepID=UPI003DA560EA